MRKSLGGMFLRIVSQNRSSNDVAFERKIDPREMDASSRE
jgi:hypothetical protein